MPKMVKARLVFTARGENIITEPYDVACSDCEEIGAVEDYEVPYGTPCGICDEIIQPHKPDPPRASKPKPQRRAGA